MQNDAKFGLIVGLVLVLAVAMLFFQKEQPTSAPVQSVKAGAPAVTTKFTPPTK